MPQLHILLYLDRHLYKQLGPVSSNTLSSFLIARSCHGVTVSTWLLHPRKLESRDREEEGADMGLASFWGGHHPAPRAASLLSRRQKT
jgi:hypothetical protein